jgi:quercetin dioxygenase-like cupin family protein
VAVDGTDHKVAEGDTIFIAAEYPHGVKTDPTYSGVFTFAAFGHPHMALESRDRMKLVESAANDDAA